LGRLARTAIERAIREVSRNHAEVLPHLDFASALRSFHGEEVTVESFLHGARWSGPDRALGATLILRALSTLDGRRADHERIGVVFGDVSTDVLEIHDELVVVLGTLHANAVVMQFRGTGMGELWVAGDARIGVVDSDESICIAGSLRADAVWGRHNDGSFYVLGRLEAEVLIADDHVVAASSEQITTCWDGERNRFELDEIRDRLVPEAFEPGERPMLKWRRLVERKDSVVRLLTAPR